MRNHGNHVASLSQLGRWLAEQAEEAGATILPETAGEKLLVDRRRACAACAPATRAAAGTASSSPKFEPGGDLLAQVTVLAEGTQGHLTGAAIDRFGLEGENPQVWALGVKEVWKVAKPLDRVIHTMGWPLRGAAKYREFGGSFVYPMGDDMLSIGLVVGLDYRDVELSVHDLLQELKTHPMISEAPARAASGSRGARRRSPRAAGTRCRRQLHAPGPPAPGDAAGTVNVPALKGIHYAIESGILAAEAIFAALQPGEVAGGRARSRRTTRRCARA